MFNIYRASFRPSKANDTIQFVHSASKLQFDSFRFAVAHSWTVRTLEQWSLSTSTTTDIIQFTYLIVNCILSFASVAWAVQIHFWKVCKCVKFSSPFFLFFSKKTGRNLRFFTQIFSSVQILQFPRATMGRFSGVVPRTTYDMKVRRSNEWYLGCN